MTKPNRERYERLQKNAQDAAIALDTFKIDMAVRYGSVGIVAYSAGERTKLKTLSARLKRHEEKFFLYLTSIAPRDWSAGVPFHWLRDSLTFADATTRGPLSTIPPAAWGYPTHHNASFAHMTVPE